MMDGSTGRSPFPPIASYGFLSDCEVSALVAPTDYEAEHVLLRSVKCVSGTVEFNLTCEPLFEYGRAGAQWEYFTHLGLIKAVMHVIRAEERRDSRHFAPLRSLAN